MHLKQNLEGNLQSKMFLFKMKRLKIKKLVENKRIIIRKLENYQNQKSSSRLPVNMEETETLRDQKAFQKMFLETRIGSLKNILRNNNKK